VITLRGDRVVLRPFSEEEVPAVAVRTTAGDLDAAGRFVAESGTWTERPTGLILAIEVDHRLVGELQARGDRAQLLPEGVYELGLEVYDAEDRGQGIGSDAVATVTRYLFDDEHAHRVQISTPIGNGAMRGSAERAGFTYEGTLRSYRTEPPHDEPTDYAMYARTRDDHEG
jgi:RimJ/RimL family protein N-acetyltransferase